MRENIRLEVVLDDAALIAASLSQLAIKIPVKQVLRPANCEMCHRPSRSFIFAPLISRRSRGGQLNQISVA
jgi:hypothetical protein